MSESKDDLDALLSIGADADLLLKALDDVPEEAQPHSVQPQPTPSILVVSPHHDSAFQDELELENPVPGMLIVGIFLTLSLLVWFWQTKPQEPASHTPPLGYSFSCGSL